MFRANATREDIYATGHEALAQTVEEVEDYFRERRWPFEGFRAGLSRHRKDMAVSWLLPRVPEVPTVHWSDHACLSLGIRKNLDPHVAMAIYAGVEGMHKEPVALARLERPHRESLLKGLVRWDNLAWDMGELLMGLRHRRLARKELDAAIVRMGRLRLARRPLTPWSRVGRLYEAYQAKKAPTSWHMLGEFQKAVWSRTPVRQMEQCVEFAKSLPVEKEWVTCPELLERQGRLDD